MTTKKFRSYLITFRLRFSDGFTTFRIARFMNGARLYSKHKNPVMVISRTVCSLDECWVHIKDLERDGLIRLTKRINRKGKEKGVWEWV
jgi:hypothetical protein